VALQRLKGTLAKSHVNPFSRDIHVIRAERLLDPSKVDLKLGKDVLPLLL
jgi:hypothetical protein